MLDYSDTTGATTPGGRFGGPHAGGCLFAFGDGSVRTVTYGVLPDVFWKLCHIADKEPLSESDYD